MTSKNHHRNEYGTQGGPKTHQVRETPYPDSKLPPQALEYESAVLGAMMIESRCIDTVSEIIKTPEVFYKPGNELIFNAIMRLYHSGRSIDFLTVTTELRSSGNLENAGSSYYVTSLTRDVVSSAHIEEHCRILVQKYLARELIRLSALTLSRAYDETEDVFDLLGDTEIAFGKLSEDNIQNPYAHISTGATEDVVEIAEHMQRIKENGVTLTGIDTGFPTLNRITNGWQRKDLIILAARPSVGKTAFALNLALNSKVPVGFFSLEMGIEQLRRRITSIQTQIGLTNITSCQLSDTEFERISGNIQRLKGTPLFVDDTSSLTVFDIKAKARRMVKKEGVRMIIVDYLQLISPPKDNRYNREQQIALISRELKKLAKELNVPVIALSQLSRDVEKSATKREPLLSDLRESGAIEQDADLIMFLFWFDGVIRGKIAKHRNGKIDHVDFNANLDIQTFSEVGTDFPASGYTGFKATAHSGAPPALKPMGLDDDFGF